jgi:hypothetical protein
MYQLRSLEIDMESMNNETQVINCLKRLIHSKLLINSPLKNVDLIIGGENYKINDGYVMIPYDWQ